MNVNCPRQYLKVSKEILKKATKKGSSKNVRKVLVW